MTPAEGYETMKLAIDRIERIDERDAALLNLLKLRKNVLIYQQIVTTAIPRHSEPSELHDVIGMVRKDLNGIIPSLNHAILWGHFPLTGIVLRRRVRSSLREYVKVRESLSYLISLVDSVLADEFDACNA